MTKYSYKEQVSDTCEVHVVKFVSWREQNLSCFLLFPKEKGKLFFPHFLKRN